MVEYENNKELINKAVRIKLLITDVDGVLTDTGVYYSGNGEELKRFSLRDGMGVERLRTVASVETAIITGENSPIVASRAKKLKINEVHLGIKSKIEIFDNILKNQKLTAEEIAYIGDDTNDLEVMEKAGLSASPADGTKFAKKVADIIVESNGGHGAFRDFAEFIIYAKNNQ